MGVYKRGSIWWYRFNWHYQMIRVSTKQTNKRVAEQAEAAHKTALAKGDFGIRERRVVPTFAQFVERSFLPHVNARFASKPSTLAYYTIQVRHLHTFKPIAQAPLDRITPTLIAQFVEKRRKEEYEVASINRALQVLRRVLNLAIEWGETERIATRVSLLPGEKRRERVLSPVEEAEYFKAARKVAEGIQERYRRALGGIRAVYRGEQPVRPDDPNLLHDVATVLLECGLRPEECFRLRWEHIRDNALHIPFGKTSNARRSIPLSRRVQAIIDMRRPSARSEWVFPAPTKTGHVEQSTLRDQHAKACVLAKINAFPFYTFRHTCLTRWSAHMDPYTLAYFAGHRDFGTTRRYVHPDLESGRAAIERAAVAQGGHNSGHTPDPLNSPINEIEAVCV